jgi:MFS family permease
MGAKTGHSVSPGSSVSQSRTEELSQPLPATTPDTEALGQSAIRKNTWRLVPILALAQFFSYLDRTNVGFAALTMNRDLHLSATQFGFAAGIFYIGYCIFEVPSNLALYRFGARLWLARIMISWGFAAAATIFAVGPTSYSLLRVLVGAAEAGFFPGVIYYLSMWFPVRSRARVLAWFLVAIPISSILGGPVSAVILQMNGFFGLSGWRWLFIIEGFPSCVCGLITLFMLADTPATAKWLTQPERDALMAMLEQEPREREKRSLLPALKDVRVLLLTANLFFWMIGLIGIGMWLPLILKGHGHMSDLRVGFLSSIPYIVGSVAMLAWARQVDRTRKYIKYLALAQLLTAGGFAFAVFYFSLTPALIGITVAMVGLCSIRPCFYAIPSRFLSGIAAAGGIAFINGVGQLGGMVGPTLVGWLKDTTGSYSAGMFALAVTLVVSALLTLSLKLVVKTE